MAQTTTLGAIKLRPLTDEETDKALSLSMDGDTHAVLHTDGEITFHSGAWDYATTCLLGTEAASRIIRDED
jgi:hypothetical protein